MADFNRDFGSDFSGIYGGGASPNNFNGPQPRIRQAYDVPNTQAGANFQVGTVSMPVLSEDDNRNGVVFVNPGAQMIYVSPDNLPAVIGQGVPIPPGGTVTTFMGNDVVKWTCGWNAIAAAGAANALTVIVR